MVLRRLLLVFWICGPGGYSAVTDGRHSYSLTTFNTDGKLEQVERALVASSMGTPIVGIIKGDRILLSSPQILPSPLMNDDGTSRFAVVSPQIVVGHSGISADGRVLVESAQRLAIEHAYTFDEPISIRLFLEEISLLFQEYTMKPGARPFGCTLLVGFLPPIAPSTTSRSSRSKIKQQKPRLFQIDCSGTVVEHDTIAIINGKFPGEDLKTNLMDFAKKQNDEVNEIEKDRESISKILQEALEITTKTKKKETIKTKLLEKESSGGSGYVYRLPMRIISASFSRKEGFKVERRVASSGLERSMIQ
ncbi:MAG: 20S proteasome alpha/beta subunit [Bacillariaceae sp.]|jgi:20S proteasome alpha/beta subunit